MESVRRAHAGCECRRQKVEHAAFHVMWKTTLDVLDVDDEDNESSQSKAC